MDAIVSPATPLVPRMLEVFPLCVDVLAIRWLPAVRYASRSKYLLDMVL